jgi:hypothetical protein
MKKLFVSLFILAGLSLNAFSAVGPKTLVSEPGLTYSNTYPQNLNGYALPGESAAKLSAQITFASATIANQTFSDGSQSTGSLTVVSTSAIVALSATDSITVPSTAAILGSPATNQITVISTTGLSGVTITLNNGVQNFTYTYGLNWTSTDTINDAASLLATAMNGSAGIVANAVSNVVYATTTLNSTLSNAYTLSSSSPTVASVSGATFTGGLNPALLGASFTLGGLQYKRGLHWSDTSGTCSGTANSIATFINSVSTTNAQPGQGIGNVIATVASGCVINLVTATSGAANNGITLTSTGPNGKLTIGTPTFVGGQSNASITINGVTLTNGTSWPTPQSSSTTANVASAIVAAIQANSALNAIINVAATGSVVNSTSVANGVASNYTTVSSTPAALTFSNPTMTGGKNAAFALNSGVINIPSHGFTKALPVLLTTGGGTIGPLVNATTYYAVIVDANDIGLSSTSAVAQTGNYLTITSTAAQTTAHTLTLAPLAFSQGSAAAFWQVSNDGINWATYSTTQANVAVASQTFTVSGSSTVVQDFGPIDYGWLRYNVTAPTQGGLTLSVILNAKD